MWFWKELKGRYTFGNHSLEKLLFQRLVRSTVDLDSIKHFENNFTLKKKRKNYHFRVVSQILKYSNYKLFIPRGLNHSGSSAISQKCYHFLKLN